MAAPDEDVTEQAGATPAPRSGPGLGQRLFRATSLVVLVAFTFFAAVNAQYVDFNWILGGTEVVEEGGDRISGGVPLIVLMVASFAAGALVAWLASWRSRRRRTKRRQREHGDG